MNQRARVGRAVDLVAQLAADHPHAIDDADRVHPAAALRIGDDTVLDVGQPDDLALVAGFLRELAQDGLLGRLAELETAPGSVQISPAATDGAIRHSRMRPLSSVDRA